MPKNRNIYRQLFVEFIQQKMLIE